MIIFQRTFPDNAIICSDASMNYFGTLLVKVRLQRGDISLSPSYSSIGYIGPLRRVFA